jgi:hypothetical protein
MHTWQAEMIAAELRQNPNRHLRHEPRLWPGSSAALRPSPTTGVASGSSRWRAGSTLRVSGATRLQVDAVAPAEFFRECGVYVLAADQATLAVGAEELLRRFELWLLRA